MRQDRILALVLIIICVVVALGNWLGGGTPRPEQVGSGRGIRTRGQADVALLEVYGMISDQPTTTPFATNDTSNSNALIKAIRQARNDQVKAILLHINSPGGTPAASQAIYNELMRTREETDIKIIASMGDVAASGAYYVASAAHHIVANPASVTGSIGVIVRTQNVSPLLDNIGVQTDNIKSGQYKDILSPFRETTSDERQIVQGIVMDSYQQFLDAIVAAREISMEQLKPLADGRVFTGRGAKELNLVDSLGNSYDALQKTAELANIQGEPKVRNYTSGFLQQPFDMLFSSFWQQLIPGYQTIRQRIDWNKLPLLVME
ncbi:signal peptide peptidase SppA [Coleofasciculus sp.]|uniref:signal peptide peptidase SppA n=1 Tax=Coleofasciculus sp. TaxID=3100458 RepID=UPI0039F8AF81